LPDLQRAFEPGHIPILPEFAPIAGKRPHMPKPETLVQRNRRRIGQCDPRHNSIDVLARDQIEQGTIEQSPHAALRALRTAVDGRFHGRFVSFLGTEARGPCISNQPPLVPIIYRNHQPMPLTIGVFFEPTRESFEGKRLRIEGDRRIQDVVVINLHKPGQVGEQCRPGRDITHFECFSSRFYSTMRRAEPQLRLRLFDSAARAAYYRSFQHPGSEHL